MTALPLHILLLVWTPFSEFEDVGASHYHALRLTLVPQRVLIPLLEYQVL